MTVSFFLSRGRANHVYHALLTRFNTSILFYFQTKGGKGSTHFHTQVEIDEASLESVRLPAPKPVSLVIVKGASKRTRKPRVLTLSNSVRLCHTFESRSKRLRSCAYASVFASAMHSH